MAGDMGGVWVCPLQLQAERGRAAMAEAQLREADAKCASRVADLEDRCARMAEELARSAGPDEVARLRGRVRELEGTVRAHLGGAGSEESGEEGQGEGAGVHVERLLAEVSEDAGRVGCRAGTQTCLWLLQQTVLRPPCAEVPAPGVGPDAGAGGASAGAGAGPAGRGCCEERGGEKRREVLSVSIRVFRTSFNKQRWHPWVIRALLPPSQARNASLSRELASAHAELEAAQRALAETVGATGPGNEGAGEGARVQGPASHAACCERRWWGCDRGLPGDLLRSS